MDCATICGGGCLDDDQLCEGCGSVNSVYSEFPDACHHNHDDCNFVHQPEDPVVCPDCDSENYLCDEYPERCLNAHFANCDVHQFIGVWVDTYTWAEIREYCEGNPNCDDPNTHYPAHPPYPWLIKSVDNGGTCIPSEVDHFWTERIGLSLNAGFANIIVNREIASAPYSGATWLENDGEEYISFAENAISTDEMKLHFKFGSDAFTGSSALYDIKIVFKAKEGMPVDSNGDHDPSSNIINWEYYQLIDHWFFEQEILFTLSPENYLTEHEFVVGVAEQGEIGEGLVSYFFLNAIPTGSCCVNVYWRFKVDIYRIGGNTGGSDLLITSFGGDDGGGDGDMHFIYNACVDIHNEPMKPGDVNGSGEVNVLDIVKLATCVLADTCIDDEGAVCAGDITQDGEINILDIVTLAQCVLADSCED